MEKRVKCNYFRNDDGICWCEIGCSCKRNFNKSDCMQKDCKRRYNVEVLLVK